MTWSIVYIWIEGQFPGTRFTFNKGNTMLRKWLFTLMAVIVILNLIVAAAGEKLFALKDSSALRNDNRLNSRPAVFTITDGNVLTVTDGLTVEFLKNDFSDMTRLSLNSR